MSLITNHEILLNILSFKSFESRFTGSYKFQFKFFEILSENSPSKHFSKPYYIPADNKGKFSEKTFESQLFFWNPKFETDSQTMCGFRVESPWKLSENIDFYLEIALLVDGLDPDWQIKFPKDSQNYSVIETQIRKIKANESFFEFNCLFFEECLPCRINLLISFFITGFGVIDSLENKTEKNLKIDNNNSSKANLSNILEKEYNNSKLSFENFSKLFLNKIHQSTARMFEFLNEICCFLNDIFSNKKNDVLDEKIKKIREDLKIIKTQFGSEVNIILSRFYNQSQATLTNFGFPVELFKDQIEKFSSNHTFSQKSIINGKDENFFYSSASNQIENRVIYNFIPQKMSKNQFEENKMSISSKIQELILQIHSSAGFIYQMQSILIEIQQENNSKINEILLFFDQLKKRSTLEISFDSKEFLAQKMDLQFIDFDKKLNKEVLKNQRHKISEILDKSYKISQKINEKIPQTAPIFNEVFFPHFSKSDKNKLSTSFNKSNQNESYFPLSIDFKESPKSMFFANYQSNKSNNPLITHLVVLVHGFKGSEFDLFLYKNRLINTFRHIKCLNSSINVGVEDIPISSLGLNLANEIKNYITNKKLVHLKKISFIGHSLGGLIIRAALPHLKESKQLLHAYFSLGTPHLGMIDYNSVLVKAGFSLFKKATANKILQQLDFTDASNFEDCEISKLANFPDFDLFRMVVLVGSSADGYCNQNSALINLSDKNSEQAKFGLELMQIAKRISKNFEKIDLVKVSIDMEIMERNLDWFIGRTPHILLIDSVEIVEQLINRFFFLFKDN